MKRAGPSLGIRIGLLFASSVVAAILGWFVWSGLDHEPPPIEVTDTTKEIDRLLEERRGETTVEVHGPSSSYPPPLQREPLDLETARLFFRLAGVGREYDPRLYFASPPSKETYLEFPEHPAGGFLVKTNRLGMREDEEVRAEKADLRILVTGDSHADGLCANSESFSNLLEGALSERDPERSVEVLNASAGGYALYNYLSVLEYYLDLDPDVFICAIYGGNDFAGQLRLQRYFHRRGPPNRRARHGTLRRLRDSHEGLILQELSQACYFATNPDDVMIAVDTAASIAVEMQNACREKGIRLIFVYLPPHLRGQPQHFEAEFQECEELLEGASVDLGLSDAIADAMVDFLASRQVELLDQRPIFSACPDPLFYRVDRHLNVRGHQVIAEALLPFFE